MSKELTIAPLRAWKVLYNEGRMTGSIDVTDSTDYEELCLMLRTPTAEKEKNY